MAAPKLKKGRHARAPTCPHCGREAVLVTGDVIYPSRPDLADKKFWLCRADFAYVGCHPNTHRALGTPANAELRKARKLLHELRVDPLWKTADATGGYDPEDEAARIKIRKAARTRVYAWLAHRLGISDARSHVGEFTLEECRAAWRALDAIDYPQIRAWAHERRAAAMTAAQQEREHGTGQSSGGGDIGRVESDSGQGA